MKHAPFAAPILLAFGILALSACQPQAPDDPGGDPSAEAASAEGMTDADMGPAEGMSPGDMGPAEGMSDADMGPAEGMSPGDMAPPSIMSPSDVDPASGPSFDCAKASNDSEKMVCSDPALAALDRQLEALYAKRMAATAGADHDALQATQRGWVKGRDECWKAEDTQRCVREAYQTRLVELQINGGEAGASKAVAFDCEGDSQPFTATFYNDIEPRAAVLALGNDQAIAIAQPAASGSKYGREGVEFWEHQGEATVDFYGTRLSCTPAG